MVCSYKCIVVALALLQAAVVSYCALSPQFPANVQLISVGGYDSSQSTSDVDIISISSNSHKKAVPMPASRYAFGSTVANNTILVVGGKGVDGNTNDFLAYEPSANNWTFLPSFPYKIYGNAVVSFNGSIFSFGGVANNYGYINYTYKYDPSEQIWWRLPVLPTNQVYFPCAVADAHSIYLIASNGEMYRTNDGAHSWTQLNSTIEGHWYGACVLLESGAILVAGGEPKSSKSPLNSVEICDASTNIWSSAPSMSRARDYAQAVVIPGSNDVVVCGGADFPAEVVYADCELFSPKENQWGFTAFSLDMPRHEYGLFVIEG